MPHAFLAPATRPPKPEKSRRLGHADTPVPPPTPGERAKWLEARLGHDPKAEADRRRARAFGGPDAGGCLHDGAWCDDLAPATREMVRGPAPDPRDGIGRHHAPEPGVDDDVPALPEPLAETALKPRWEAFARLYAFGHSAADAARHAGYAWDSAAHSGWRLLQDQRVLDRVRVLQAHFAATLAAEDEDLMVRAEAVYREAMNRGHYGAAIRALEFTERCRRRLAADAERQRNAVHPGIDGRK